MWSCAYLWREGTWFHYTQKVGTCILCMPECILGEMIEAVDPSEHTTCSAECSGSRTSASLSRAVGLLKPSSASKFVRLVRQRTVTNPTSIVPIVLAAVLSMIMAAARASTIRRVRDCRDCKGYGISQCTLCGGDGVKTWEGKYFHKDEPCPLCLGARYTKCKSCGGHHTRSIFVHATSPRSSYL